MNRERIRLAREVVRLDTRLAALRSSNPVLTFQVAARIAALEEARETVATRMYNDLRNQLLAHGRAA